MKHDRLNRISTPTTIAVLAAIGAVFYLMSNVLLPFVVAGVVALVCTPLIDWLSRRTRMPRTLIAVIIFLVLLAAAAGIGYLGVPALLSEIAKIVSDLHGTIESAARRVIGNQTATMFGTSMTAGQIADAAVNGLRNWLSHFDRILKLATLTFAALFGLILAWVLLLYFLIGGPRIARGLFWLVPPRQRPLATEIWSDLAPVLERYFFGVGIVVLYASTAAYIGLGVVLEIHHAVFLALLTGLLEMIPVVGPAVSAVSAGLVAVTQAKSMWSIVAYAIYATALRLSIDQMIGPLVLGRAGRVHPVLVIFCFITGGILFGITGVILAVPAALAIKVVLANLYEEPLTTKAQH